MMGWEEDTHGLFQGIRWVLGDPSVDETGCEALVPSHEDETFERCA
jgi:hypothetical protein